MALPGQMTSEADIVALPLLQSSATPPLLPLPLPATASAMHASHPLRWAQPPRSSTPLPATWVSWAHQRNSCHDKRTIKATSRLNRAKPRARMRQPRERRHATNTRLEPVQRVPDGTVVAIGMGSRRVQSLGARGRGAAGRVIRKRRARQYRAKPKHWRAQRLRNGRTRK